MKDKFVINIGRQLGSGGKAVGEAVAARLGIGVYDKQLINLAAEQSGICPEIFEKADEKESRNLFATFIGYLRSPFVGSEYSGSNVLSSDALFKIQSDVIRDLASRESCVFVGRCADYILRDHPRTVNIFIAAGRAERIERLCRLHGIAPGEAESLMDRTDAGAPPTTIITAAARGEWLRPMISASIRRCWESTARPVSCWNSWNANWA